MDSGASVHATNSKEDLNDPETTSQAVTIGSGKVMDAQFKGRSATILTYGWRNIGTQSHPFHSELWQEDCQPLQVAYQGYKAEEWIEKTQLLSVIPL